MRQPVNLPQPHLFSPPQHRQSSDRAASSYPSGNRRMLPEDQQSRIRATSSRPICMSLWASKRSAMVSTLPFETLTQVNYILVFLYYWIFSRDISLNLFLWIYFPEQKEKKKQESEWRQTLVSSYFSTPPPVVSLSPFISWCSLFLCLFYVPRERKRRKKEKKKKHCKAGDFLVSALG